MFDDKDKLIQALKHPLTLASMSLDEFENRLGGTKIISDPNTPFCHLLEMNSTIATELNGIVENKFEALYPKRATNMEDLYMHMSDFDYLKMYSNPANTVIRVTFPKQYLITYAENYNNNYKRVTIQRDTVFTIGKYQFGLYYPINIQINNYTKTFSASYDTSETNPLFSLTQNTVDKVDWEHRGIEYISLSFPVYQFSKSVITKTIMAATGFAEKIIYNNNFYALRIFSVKNGVYTELAQSQSTKVYDAAVPTVLVRVLPDEHKIKLVLPQVYFDRGQLGSQLYIEVYTTVGALNINTTNVGVSAIGVTFGTGERGESNTFGKILKTLPFDTIIQLDNTKITGGSNAISFSDLRDRVVNNTLYDRVPITENELTTCLQQNGFYVKKFTDDITNRIYYAYKTLVDSNNDVIPSITAPARLSQADSSDVITFIDHGDETVTILPTTVWTYLDGTDSVRPLTTNELKVLAGADKNTLAEILNTKHYFKSPFHTVMDFDDTYPEAISYNLMSPKVNSIFFEAENFEISAKISLYQALVNHAGEGVGGYDFKFSIYFSDEIAALDKSYIRIYILTKTTSGVWIRDLAEYAGPLGDRSLYKFHLDTNYHLSSDGTINVISMRNDAMGLGEYTINLSTNFYLVAMVHREGLSGSYQEASNKVTVGIPTDELGDYVAITRERLSVTLGESLQDVIHHNVECSTTAAGYETWEYNVPATYSDDVYETDENGGLVTTIDEEGNVHLNKIHSKGDAKVNDDGTPIYLHRKGDVVLDANNNPKIAKKRTNQYYVDMLLIDAKVFASERNAQLTFASEIYDTLSSYFTNIRNIQGQLLEQTNLYFRCVRSTGTATFNHGDGLHTTGDIEMSFRIVCYVPSYVKTSTAIQATIYDRICEAINAAIDTKTINMLDIFTEVQGRLSDYIDHFDLLGINDDVTNQTFIIMEEDAQASIAKELVLSDDNILNLQNKLEIQYVTLDANKATETVSV